MPNSWVKKSPEEEQEFLSETEALTVIEAETPTLILVPTAKEIPLAWA